MDCWSRVSLWGREGLCVGYKEREALFWAALSRCCREGLDALGHWDRQAAVCAGYKEPLAIAMPFRWCCLRGLDGRSPLGPPGPPDTRVRAVRMRARRSVSLNGGGCRPAT